MQTRTLLALSASAAFLLALATGCAETTGDNTTGPDAPRTSGLALTSDTLGNTDVGGMRFTVTGCSGTPSAGFTESVDKDLEDMYLPGGISEFEDAPYDADSQHLFSDHYFLLSAGCYDVETQPLQANGQLSQDCASAHRDNVNVEDGKTREILLINQCKGPAKGGLDVLGTINHPPEILDVEFKDSKFLNSCTGQNEVCVTVSDPDDDPLEVAWSSSQNYSHQGSIQPLGQATTNSDGSVTHCGKITTGPRGAYGFTLTAWDLATNDVGQIDRIEDILSQQGDPNSSRDEIEFPIYAGMDCQGRSSVVLMAMNNDPGPANDGYADPFIKQLSSWVSPLTSSVTPNVLHVLDDANQNEHPGNAAFVINALEAQYGAANVDGILEPSSGLTMSDVQGYDIVWFVNPGWPMDDASSYDTLQNFLGSGGGLVIEGDDMAHAALSGGRDMDWFTHLNYQDNGETTCGDTTNNNVGNPYTVTFTNEPISALNGSITDLRGQTFQYGNDIDHTTREFSGERVLAQAVYSKGQCSESYPAAVAIDPADLP